MHHYQKTSLLIYICFTILLIKVKVKKKKEFFVRNSISLNFILLHIHSINIYQAPSWYLEKLLHAFLLNGECAITILIAETWGK